MQVHDAAHAALDSTGGSTSAMLRNAVLGLRDNALGSRVTGAASAVPPAGAAVGSASTFQNAGIPETVSSAISNLNTNTQNATLANLLSQVLHGTSGNAPSPAQEALFKSQADLNRQALAAHALPGQIQNKIDTFSQQNPQLTGVMSISPALPGSYNPAKDNEVQNLRQQLVQAKQAASGWNPQIY
jgi:hypothetical protein